jgi:hypothetical protein
VSEREYERKRYARDRKKRIAAEQKWRRKVKDDPEHKQKVKARSDVRTKRRNGTAKPPATCPKCGRRAKLEFHHSNYKTGAGFWRCSRCNPRPGRNK